MGLEEFSDVSFCLQSVFAAVCIVVGTIDTLLQGLEFVVIFFTLLNIIGVLILRVTHKQEPRIFKVSLTLRTVLMVNSLMSNYLCLVNRGNCPL